MWSPMSSCLWSLCSFRASSVFQSRTPEPLSKHLFFIPPPFPPSSQPLSPVSHPPQTPLSLPPPALHLCKCSHHFSAVFPYIQLHLNTHFPISLHFSSPIPLLFMIETACPWVIHFLFLMFFSSLHPSYHIILPSPPIDLMWRKWRQIAKVLLWIIDILYSCTVDDRVILRVTGFICRDL